MAGKMTKALRRVSGQTRQRRNLPHLASRLFGTPLFVDGRKLDAIIPVFTRKINGEPEAELNDSDYREDGGNMNIDTAAGIAIIPIIGSLIRRPTWIDAYSGLTSYNDISECLDSAINDARVKGILLQVDSFGGEAAGCFELCDKIYQARQVKPIWSVADVDALSAGYAILSSAEKAFADPNGSAGSIGVVAIHSERSQMNAAMGITYTVFRAGDRKAEFNPYEKLTSDAAIKMLTSMEKMRDRFAQTVSRNRNGLDVSVIMGTEGQWYDPDDAKSIGLIDDVLTYDGVFSQFAAFLSAPPIVVQAPEDDEIEPSSGGGEDGDEDEDEDDDDDDNSETPDGIPEQQTAEVISMADVTKPNTPPNKPAAPKTAAAPTPPQTATAPVATAEVVHLDDARPNSETREVQIANMCKIAGKAELAADFIIANKSLAEVQTELLNARAEADKKLGEVSGQHPGKITGGFSPGPNQAAVASWGDAFKKAQSANPNGFPASGR